jgi:hypothetical protein
MVSIEGTAVSLPRAFPPTCRLVHHYLRAGDLRAEPADRLPVAGIRPGDGGSDTADLQGR